MKKHTRKPFQYSFSELIDKLSITSKKDLYNLPGAKEELSTILKWLNDIGIDGYTLLSIIRISMANSDIWNLEHALRNAVVGDMAENVVGRIAEKVRDHNKTRVRYMNELNHACGDKQVVEKIRHLSEEVYDKYYKGLEQASTRKIGAL